MSSENLATAAAGKRLKKAKSTEVPSPLSVKIAQNPAKEVVPEAGRNKKRRKRTKKPKQPSTKSMGTEAQLTEDVKRLHDHTKQVKSKLKKLNQTIPQKELEVDKEIIRAIEKLKLEQLRLENLLATKAENKSRINGDQAHECEVEKQSKRFRKKKNLDEDSNKLHAVYEKHINQIVSEDNSDLLAKLKYTYGENLEEFAQKCVKAGLGRIVESELRINAKNNHQSFITVDDGADAMISSMAARMYAMEGDIVRVFVRNKSDKAQANLGNEEEPVEDVLDITLDEVDNIIQCEVEILETATAATLTRRHAFVISIVERKGNRQFVGTIALRDPIKFDSQEYFKFKPRDMKVSMIYIPVESCVDIAANQKPEDMMGLLYIAEISSVGENGRCVGVLKEPVGKCGNLESEIKAILLHNGLRDITPFEERFNEMYSSDAELSKDDMEGRADLRNECIFTIDPLTARDLDDALSCKQLNNGCYEIGVHISDVTTYLKEKCELDEIVKLRATSIYLANEVIHMLPMSLCRKCSLLPGEDKLTFSVFWVMDEQGIIKSTRFTKSVIRSCTQFAYEHAQKIIDNPQEQFTIDDFPTICGKFTIDDIIQRIHAMNKIAENMRKRRYLNGCLSIDNPEFYFQFDPKTGEPISFETATRSSANFMIEEFMLQANQSVAHFIYERFPEIAFLRNHQPPKQSGLNNLKAKLTKMGIELNMDSSKAIHEGMQRICAASSDPEVMAAGLSYLLTKPMVRSKYFCSSLESTPADLFHYALAIPIYTHFTSPIRRYPDVIVHRLLAAALDYTPPPKRTADELNVLAKICNDQKYNAKNASDESANMFFLRYVKAKTKVQLRAVVTDIYRHSLEVVTLKTGRLITLQYKVQKVIIDASAAPNAVYISEKNSKKPPLELRVFSPVNIVLKVKDTKLIAFFESPDYEQRSCNYINESLKKKKPKKNRKKKLAKNIESESEKPTGDH